MVDNCVIMQKKRGLFPLKIRGDSSLRRRKQVYKYVQAIADGKFKSADQIREPLIYDTEGFLRWGSLVTGPFAFMVGFGCAPLYIPKLLRQKDAQAEVDSVQQVITSAQGQVEAIRVQQQDGILQPKIDTICEKLMNKYHNLDLSNSTASTLLNDLNQAYQDSYHPERLNILSPFPIYNVVRPECKEFYKDYNEIVSNLTPQITTLQEETPIDVRALPESVLSSDLLSLSESSIRDFVDPSVIADSQIDTIMPSVFSGIQCATLGILGVGLIAGYYQIQKQRYEERWYDYKMATDLCLRGKQMSTCTNGETPQSLKNLNFKNEADLCPETIAFATSPKDFDEFNRNFDEYINCCQYRYDDLGIAFNSDAFTPYISSDANLSQAK